jgi:hypothetical protein
MSPISQFFNGSGDSTLCMGDDSDIYRLPKVDVGSTWERECRFRFIIFYAFETGILV